MKRRSFDESDLIRLNLERLDIQTRQQTIAERLFSEAPLMPYAAAFIIGILFADAACRDNRLFWLISAGVFAAAGLCFILSFRAAAPLRLRFLLSCACLVIFSLAAVRCYSLLAIGPNHILHYMGSSRRELATLQGKVISPVITNDADSSIPWLEPKSWFYLKTSGVKTSSGWQKTSGIVRVQAGESISRIQPGNTVRIYCWLSSFEPPANPGQFDLRRYMHRKEIYLAAAVDMQEGIEILDSSSSYIAKIRAVLCRAAGAALLDETITDEDAASLASALLLGRRSGLSPLLMAAFRDTNLAHYISLSGMHVGILAGSLWRLLRTAGLSKRPRAVLCIFLILIYALIVPPRAPTMRAVILSCFFLFSVLAARRPNPLNTLALSAVILLFIRPYDLFNAGWQLSFLSVLGILLFCKPVQFYLLNWFFYPVIPYLRFFGMQYFLHSLLEMLAVGLSAWAAIAGILLFYFSRINPLSPLWTVLTFPFVIIILYAGFLKILLASVLPTAAALFGLILNLAAAGFERTVLVLAKIDFCQIAFHRPSSLLIGFIYFLIAVLYLLPFQYNRTKKGLFSLLIISFLLPPLWQKISSSRQNVLEMVCLSVGHGQAVVLSGPAGEHIIFDAGSITHQQAAAKVIVPFLQQKSIFKLDAAYLSHGDLDHINAIADLAGWIGIRAVYANSILLASAQKPSVEKELKDYLERLHMPLLPPADFHSSKGMTIRSIWPTQEIVSNLSISENDKSQVFLIEYAGRKILLCGDIETYAQSELMRLDPPLRADVVVLPHHGSSVNLAAGFVEHFQPQVVIASCAANRLANVYRPAPASGIQAFFTPSDGAVAVKIKADGTFSAVGFLSSNK